MQKEHWMKHPFWIVNSLLFFLVILTFIFMYFSRVKIPERESIDPVYVPSKKDLKLDINIRKIYEDDLFGTYIKEIKPIQQDLVTPFPEPPSSRVTTMPTEIIPEFLEPLDITLKGIVVISTNDTKNRAIISDNKTKREDMYKVGDNIEDAQLIRIFRNKVIFLRSNGQQEVLYLREQDAKFDPAFAIFDGWDSAIKKVSDDNYLVDPKEFIFRITNLAQLIEVLGLTTAYQKGKSIGCRVGALMPKSVGVYLGLQSGDIILTINDIPATDTKNRLEIYNNIITLPLHEVITVELLRNKQKKVLKYTLQELDVDKQGYIKEAPFTQVSPIIKPLQKEQREEILRQKQKFAPTMKEIRARERANMFEKGKALQ
jgi:type II secretory pathway component PulC